MDDDNDKQLTQSGRRIALIANVSRLNRTIELCSIEFKKQDENTTVTTQQQSKNARVNSCILSTIDSLASNSTSNILSFEFVAV